MLAQTIRLHVSPLTPDSLTAVLRPPLGDHATDISFHTLVTFSEKSYGFVTLPIEDAERLKKRLHGSVLRGMKMRVEEARPKTSLEMDYLKVDGMEKKREKKGTKSKTASPSDERALPGFELEAGRKVRRGWTEPEGGTRKESKKSKDTTVNKNDKDTHKPASISGKEECLFKTQLPPNKREGAKTTKESDGKGKKRKRGKSNGDAVVHEFTKTEKHATFLRDKIDKPHSKTATEFVDGKGWVDTEGNVVDEGPAKRTRRASRAKADAELPKPSKVDLNDGDDDTSSSGNSSSEDAESEEEEELHAIKPNGDTSSEALKPKGLGISSTVERLSITRSSATPPPPLADIPIPTLKSPEPHPLESLFKRPSAAASQTPKEKPTLEVSTSFTFDIEGQDTESRLGIPQTPFTQLDIRQRRERSAAPTPDTAAPGKTFGNVWGKPGSSDIASGEDDEVEEDQATMLRDMKKSPPKEGEESEWAKRYYEQRGEDNRNWKQRKREGTEEKKQSNNRKRKGN